MEVQFLSIDHALRIHVRAIEEHGGDPGIRDRGLLESALAMPQATFAGDLLHSGVPEMAAAYLFHLCANHPFVDGNKRVAVVAAELFLLVNGFELAASDDELEKMTLRVASGKMQKEAVLQFFRENTVPKSNK
jgi:death-on-curing protein